MCFKTVGAAIETECNALLYIVWKLQLPHVFGTTSAIEEDIPRSLKSLLTLLNGCLEQSRTRSCAVRFSVYVKINKFVQGSKLNLPKTIVNIRMSVFHNSAENHLRAVESASFSSNVKLSPDDRKLSDKEHGLGKRVAFASIK